MTNGLMNSPITVSNIHKKLRKITKSTEIYKKYIHSYHRLSRKAKVKYYGDLLYNFKSDVSKTWRLLKSVIGEVSDKTRGI